MRKRSMVPLEHHEQVVFHLWLQKKKIFHFAVPNGSHLYGTPLQRAKQMNKLKAEGFLNGVSDMFICLDNKIIAIEMKRQKGGSVSEDQKEFGAKIQGYSYIDFYVARGAREAIAIIEDYL